MKTGELRFTRPPLIAGHEDIANKLLEKEVDALSVSGVDKYGRTALHWAAEYGYMEVARLLANKVAEQGGNISAEDRHKDTALYRAALRDHQGIVQMFMNQHASIKGSTQRCTMVGLLLAADNGHGDAVQRLLEKGANIEAADKDGRTIL
ncbi:ankyrin repeat-containing domain protein [Chaetomium strumarium]|uniref:Ankyrin repeat-containing domain protein n=1 Tax=Chaetomium strumarium TaxID=1170767 RepID=A0AAJ0H0A5_9PEZI|nr:ankyrin repeat-containing domain protein [Chaetomium strumarium]